MKPSKQDRKKYDFRKDLAFGEKGEEFVHDLVSNKGGAFEVKLDRRAIETGNIALELAYRNKPSGINATEAHWLTYLIAKDGEIVGGYTFNVELLKKNIKKHKFSTVYGGDSNASLLLLVPIKDIWKLLMPEKEEKPKDDLI